MITFIWQEDCAALARLLMDKLVAAGHQPRVLVRKGQKPADLAGEGLPAGVTQARSLAEAVKDAQAVVTLLGTPQEVEDVYLGEGGILEHAGSGGLLVDLSTSNPQLARELYALSAVHDHAFVEAPIDGNVDMLVTGEFRLFAAGEPDGLRRAEPLLRELTPQVIEVGLAGNGSITKLCSQIALAGMVMGVVEAVTFGLASGIQGDKLLEYLNQSVAASSVAQAFGKKIIDEDFYYGYDMQLFFNDLAAALIVADELGLALPSLETAHQLYDLLVLVGGGQKGIHALALIYHDEDRCARHGLNWELAQRAMDVYERASESEYADYDSYDDYDDDGCDDPFCSHHHPEEDEPPSMGKFFSSN